MNYVTKLSASEYDNVRPKIKTMIRKLRTKIKKYVLLADLGQKITNINPSKSISNSNNKKDPNNRILVKVDDSSNRTDGFPPVSIQDTLENIQLLLNSNSLIKNTVRMTQELPEDNDGIFQSEESDQKQDKTFDLQFDIRDKRQIYMEPKKSKPQQPEPQIYRNQEIKSVAPPNKIVSAAPVKPGQSKYMQRAVSNVSNVKKEHTNQLLTPNSTTFYEDQFILKTIGDFEWSKLRHQCIRINKEHAYNETSSPATILMHPELRFYEERTVLVKFTIRENYWANVQLVNWRIRKMSDIQLQVKWKNMTGSYIVQSNGKVFTHEESQIDGKVLGPKFSTNSVMALTWIGPEKKFIVTNMHTHKQFTFDVYFDDDDEIHFGVGLVQSDAEIIKWK